jgi:hypothetical protein
MMLFGGVYFGAYGLNVAATSDEGAATLSDGLAHSATVADVGRAAAVIEDFVLA